MSKFGWAAALVVLSLGIARAQDEPNGGDPIPLPFTRSGLKVIYKKGLLLRYQKTVKRRGKKPLKSFVFNEVMSHDGKGYTVRTLVFSASGTVQGKPQHPQKIPYRVESKTFRAAKEYAYERVKIGKRKESAHKYVYEVKQGGRPVIRTVWYSGKHRGLLLKTDVRAPGDRDNYTVLELMAIPGKLGGPKVIGAPQGNLPWKDEAIMKAWPQGGWAEYEVKTSGGGKKAQTLRLKQTLLGRERSCYYMREQLWAGEGKPKETGRPRLWDTWLGALRSAPKSAVEKKLDKEIEAAGRKWPCKVFTIKGKKTVTWYLSKEVPGLTVRYVSKGKGGKVERTLSKIGLPVPGSK